jgi:3-hydroxybutyryl-CoA dehydrogenase
MNDVRTICCIGTGTMGPYMAAIFAMAGYEVRMYGRTAAGIERGYRGVSACLQSCRNTASSPRRRSRRRRPH